MSDVVIVGNGRALERAKGLASEIGLSSTEILLSKNVGAEELDEALKQIQNRVHLAVDPHHLCLERAALLKIVVSRRLDLVSLISKSARVNLSARIGKNVQVGSDTVVAPGSRISDGVHIGSGCMVHANSNIGRDVWIGDAVTIGPQSTISAGTIIGDCAQIAAKSLIGSRCELAVSRSYSGILPDYSHHIHAARGVIRFVANSSLRGS
jgi:acetyltransferase-like isoleucine patch superfamily enzyme